MDGCGLWLRLRWGFTGFWACWVLPAANWHWHIDWSFQMPKWIASWLIKSCLNLCVGFHSTLSLCLSQSLSLSVQKGIGSWGNAFDKLPVANRKCPLSPYALCVPFVCVSLLLPAPASAAAPASASAPASTAAQSSPAAAPTSAAALIKWICLARRKSNACLGKGKSNGNGNDNGKGKEPHPDDDGSPYCISVQGLHKEDYCALS